MGEEKWNSVEQVHEHSLLSVNKPISELVQEKTVEYYYQKSTNKGWIGNSIEEDYFGIPNNNRQEADIPHLNLEIKVTPIYQTKKGKWSSKERLVLNIFDFNDEYKRKFEEASFFEKASRIELLFYEYIEETPSPDLIIKAVTLLDLNSLPKEDMLIIKQDWQIIVDKIIEGKAEELSDSLTKYLGATTKGSKSERNMTGQPFSDIKAHRRSFTLKTSFMTQLVRSLMDKDNQSERIIDDYESLVEKSFDQVIIEKFEPFINKKKTELTSYFNVDIPEKNDKASSRMLANKMLNLRDDIEKTEEFKKSGVSVKIVTVKKGRRKTTEGFKLTIPNAINIDPIELVESEWEDSILKDYLESTSFLLVLFEKGKNETVFKGVKFWRMPLSIIETDIRATWTRTKRVFAEGVRLEYKVRNNKKGYIVENNLPKMSDRQVLHVRPSATVASYKEDYSSMKLPTNSNWVNRPIAKKTELKDNYITKQSWWLNPDYMYEQVKELILSEKDY